MPKKIKRGLSNASNFFYRLMFMEQKAPLWEVYSWFLENTVYSSPSLDSSSTGMESLGNLWTGVLATHLEPRSLLCLSFTCKMFRDLFSQQDTELWYRLCQAAGHSFPISLAEHARDILTAATLKRCIACRFRWARTSAPHLACVVLCDHCKTPFPTMSHTDARKKYCLKPPALARLVCVSPPNKRAKYYLHCDVRATALVQWGSEEKVKVLETRTEDRKQFRQQQLARNRRVHLEDLLRWIGPKLGPEFADDGKSPSVTMQTFIEANVPTLAQVLNIELRRRLGRHLHHNLTPEALATMKFPYAQSAIIGSATYKCYLRQRLYFMWFENHRDQLNLMNRLIDRAVADLTSSRDASPTREPE